MNKEALISIIGCAVESAKEELETLNADILIGNNDKEEFFEVLDEALKEKGQACEKKVVLTDIANQKEYNEKALLTKVYDVREAVKIEDGCNNFCSYCIIPYLRGRVRSKPYEDIEKEVKGLIKLGVKEIVLVGIEVASYGKDIDGMSLIDVIEKLDKIPGLGRLRLSSLEPRFLSEENIARLASCKSLCDHFHISMQSGATDTLKRMNRKYDKTLLIEVCYNIRKYFPDAYIAVDCIVGFPGETDSEFAETIQTIEKMNLSDMHVFKYSKRAYTRAAKMSEQIEGSIKKQRSETLINIAEKKKHEFLKRNLGKTCNVLFESEIDGVLQGYTTNYIKVQVKGDKALCGTIQDVVLTSLEGEIVLGKIVE